jgi:alkanesulfonate monooxygenase SsuD/methylene tetrahydromethanopterin reductase-like flavin-dependent oxidoreductase (luciferase family)
LGAGYHQPEYTAFGFPFDRLASRFEEALQIILPLLKGERVTFQGAYYQVEDAVLHPHGPRPGGPPIWIGARQPRMLRLVATYADAYNVVGGSSPASFVDQLAALDTACREVGRDPATLQKTIACFVAFPGSEDCPGGIHANALVGTPDEVAERFKAFYEAGIDHITLFASPWGLKAVAALGQTIRHLREMGI